MGSARNHRGYLLLALAAIILCPSRSAASWDPLFRGAQLLDTGQWSTTSAYRNGGPNQLAAGDLNGDGRPDLVVVNRNDSIPPQWGNTISVLLHSPNPTAPSLFLPKTNYPALLQPGSVELADMDLDGDLDAVVRSIGDNLCVLLGTGTGSFGSPVFTSSMGIHNGFNPFGRGLVLADVNQDGLPDVLAQGSLLSSNAGRIAVLLGTGGGALGPPTLYDPYLVTSDAAYGMALGDLTGDGIADIAAVGSDRATLLQGNGSGAFTYVKDIVYTSGLLSRAVIADLNGDTVQDLALGGENILIVMVGTGGGNFTVTEQYVQSGNNFLEVGDLDQDGKLDLVTGGVATEKVSVRRGSGNGHFTTLATLYEAAHLWTGDFRLVDVNLNGRPDLVMSSPYMMFSRIHAISVILDDGIGGLGFRSVPTSVPFLSSVVHPAVADFDRNGKLDVAVAGNNQIEIGLGNGDGTFIGMVGGGATTPGTIATGDWNRDGRDDLAFQSGGTSITGWSGTGTGGFSLTPAFVIPGRTLHRRSAADMNRDGRTDFVVTTGTQVWVETQNTDGTFSESVPQTVSGTIRGLALSDWNRDGVMDVALATSLGASLVFGNGDGTLGTQLVVRANRSYADLCAGDFNRDGKLDLAMLETLAGQSGLRGIDVSLGISAGGFLVAPSLPTLEQNGLRIDSWDVNLDGFPDLVASGMPDGSSEIGDPDLRPASVEVHLGNGTGQFGPPLAHSVGLTPALAGGLSGPLFAVGDVNRDDQQDILFPSNGGAFHSLLATPPDFGNALSPRVDYTMSAATSRLAVGDLNRDGILDVVTSSTSNPVSVRLGTLQGTLGPATTVTQSLAARQIDLSDVNRDGKLDLLLARAGLGAPDLVTCMLGNGDGTFGPRIDNAIVGITEFAVGDMNKDGKPDLVTGKPDVFNSILRVLLGNGDGTFTAQLQQVPVPTTQIYDLDIADVDGRDGNLDVVLAGGGVFILHGGPSGTLTAGFPVNLGSTSFRTVCVADFDHDGFLDLAAADQTSQVVVASGAADPPFSTYLSSGTPGNAWDLQVGPAERDGRQFLYVSTTTSNVAVMQPGVSPWVFVTAGTYATGTDPEALALGDLNRDGLLDVFTANSGGGSVSVFAPAATLVTGAEVTSAPIARARLDQNAPNPFNPETTIRFAVPRSGPVQLFVYDVQGRLVSKLVDGPVPAGEQAIRWNGRSRSGVPAASGVYYYRLRTATEDESRRMVLVK